MNTSTNSPLITTHQLSKSFTRGAEEIRALKNLTLTITQREFVAVVGSSGSGKSTLLYILGLLDTPTTGAYLLNESPTETLSDEQRAELRNKFMGFVFQSFHLLPRASALRNVMMPLIYSANYGKKLSSLEQQRLAEQALLKVGLQDRLHHLPNELSGGQRQRVAIARALVNTPRVLFADEPTGNLDSKNGEEVLQIFDRLHREYKMTLVVVTHSYDVAKRADRVIHLRDGKIERESHQSLSQ